MRRSSLTDINISTKGKQRACLQVSGRIPGYSLYHQCLWSMCMQCLCSIQRLVDCGLLCGGVAAFRGFVDRRLPIIVVDYLRHHIHAS